MIWLIAKKDFLLNLLSVRFVIGFVLCLVVIPFTMIVSIDDYQNQMRIYEIDRNEAEQELRKLFVYSELRPTVVKQPEVLSIFSKGISANIGNKTKVCLQEYSLFPSGHTSSRDNPLLNAFLSIDFATVIAILISLLALVFAYDSITREREDGTMKLIFTGRVSRISFLIGKLTGLLLTLLPVLVFCYLLACLIILINPDIHITAADWTGIILLFLTSIIYMLVFVLLGMFISSLTVHSSSSIILSLLCWIGFLFLIPNMAVYLSQSISPMPLYDNVQAIIDDYHKEHDWKSWEVLQEKVKELGLPYISWWNYNNGNDGYEMLSGGKLEVALAHQMKNSWSEPARIEVGNKIWPMQKEYLDKLVRQQQVQQYLSWLSPSELFGQATDALCRTDVPAFLKYMDTQREYRETIIRFFRENNIFSSFLYFTPQPQHAFPTDQEIKDYNERGIGGPEKSGEWNRPENSYLNTDNVPRYVYTLSTTRATFRAALGRLTALLAISVFLLLGTIAVFMKYDIR